jgi:hypothetical protein
MLSTTNKTHKKQQHVIGVLDILHFTTTTTIIVCRQPLPDNNTSQIVL